MTPEANRSQREQYPRHSIPDESAAIVAALVALAGALGLLGERMTADQLALVLGAVMTLAASVRAWLVRTDGGSGGH